MNPEPAPTFIGSIPENYDRHLVPMVFAPYAQDLVSRIPLKENMKLLELACGTGVVTKQILRAVPATASIKATDLSESMLRYAELATREDVAGLLAAEVGWQVADGGNLPFTADQFDVIVCQFGVMFFPDKLAAMQEAHRVLVPGGKLIFNVWGAMPDNPIFGSVEAAMEEAMPEEPTPIMPTPCSMSDCDALRILLEDAGFQSIQVTPVLFPAKGHPASQIADGFVFGTPLAGFIKEKGKAEDEMHALIVRKVVELMGDPIDATMLAIVCEAYA